MHYTSKHEYNLKCQKQCETINATLSCWLASVWNCCIKNQQITFSNFEAQKENRLAWNGITKKNRSLGPPFAKRYFRKIRKTRRCLSVVFPFFGLKDLITCKTSNGNRRGWASLFPNSVLQLKCFNSLTTILWETLDSWIGKTNRILSFNQEWFFWNFFQIIFSDSLNTSSFLVLTLQTREVHPEHRP